MVHIKGGVARVQSVDWSAGSGGVSRCSADRQVTSLLLRVKSYSGFGPLNLN